MQRDLALTPLQRAESYVGMPYVDGEFDCADLAVLVQREVFGRAVAMPADRRRPRGARGQRAEMARLRDRLASRIAAPETGCGVLFTTPRGDGALLWHVGTVFMQHGETWVLHNSHALGAARLQRLCDIERLHGAAVEGWYAWGGEDMPVIEMEVELRPLSLVVTPHPLILDGQRLLDYQAAPLIPGESLDTFLARHGIEVGQQWIVSIGGHEVPEAMWSRTKPRHGHLIEARKVAEKDVLRIAALIALTYVTVGAAGAFATAFIGAVNVAVYVGGSLLINKLLAPKPPKASGAADNTQSPTYSLQGGRNRARLFEPMSLILGEPYVVPDLSAQPYTYFAGGEQHLWQLFHAGINCDAVDTIRIGQTAIDSYQGVTLSRDGFGAGNTGLPTLAASVDTIAGALLDAPAGTVPGPWTTRTSSVGAIQLAIDIEATLYSSSDRGDITERECLIEAEYRLVGAGFWSPLIGSSSQVALKNASTKPLRETFMRQVAPGQYEVQLRKVSANTTSPREANAVTWSTLKTYQQDTGNYAGQARVGIQILASGQLNGALDEVNWRARAKPMPYWNGSAWVTATNRATGLCNPGAIFLMLARGIRTADGQLLAGLGLPDAEIDIDSLKGFMVRCAAAGFEFDLVLQSLQSADELLDSIAAVAMGSKSWHTGKLGVVWFAEDQPVEGIQNMTTMKRGSFSVDYATAASADEIEFQYFDRQRDNSWQSIRVLAPGVTTPTNTARQQLQGVTTEAQAAILARWHMAQNVYQRKSVTFDVDLEHVVFRRGTILAVSHDVTQWGYSGRLAGVAIDAGVVTLTLDDPVPAVGPEGQITRYIALRLPGERAFRLFGVQAFAGSTRTLVLVGAWPAGVAVPGADAGNPAHDTLWTYDFKATPGYRLRVAEVSPQSNLSGARVVLVPESAEMWNYIWTGTYAPPPNNSLLVQDLPVVTGLTLTAQRVPQGDGYALELTATFDIAGNFGSAQLWAGVDGNALERIGGDISGTRVSWIGRPGVWTVEIRPFDSLGRPGARASTTQTFSDRVPGALGSLSLTVGPAGIVAGWPTPSGVDARDWGVTQLRIGSTWESAGIVWEGKAVTHSLGWHAAGLLRVWAATRSTSGVFSTPISATLQIDAPAQPLVLGSVQQSLVQLEWQDCRTTQPIAAYALRVGPLYTSAQSAGTVQALSYRRAEPKAGARRYWVVAIDAYGNESVPGYVSVTTLPSIDYAIATLQDGLDVNVDYLLSGMKALSAAASTRIVNEIVVRDASVRQVSEIIEAVDGRLSARYGVAVTVGNKVAGFLINNSGPGAVPSSFVILVDKFAIAQQDSGGATIYPFVVGSVSGIATVGINGLLVVDGTILARAISIGSLSELTQNAGVIVQGVLRNAANTVGLNLNAAGAQAVLFSPKLNLLADGGAVFAGQVAVGSNPAISGTTMTGAGALINPDGTFALGNSTGNVTFNGVGVKINGPLVGTGEIIAESATVVRSSFVAVGATSVSLPVPSGYGSLPVTITGNVTVSVSGPYEDPRVRLLVDGLVVRSELALRGQATALTYTLALSGGAHTISIDNTNNLSGTGDSVGGTNAFICAICSAR